MKKDPTIREAIDESLCAVRFNAQDERNVMAAIHGRRVRAKKRAYARRTFFPRQAHERL